MYTFLNNNEKEQIGKDIADIIKSLAKNQSQQSVFGGGNAGQAINGYFILKASENISEAINNLADALKQSNQKNDNIESETKL
jgi:hypothetical protein